MYVWDNATQDDGEENEKIGKEEEYQSQNSKKPRPGA